MLRWKNRKGFTLIELIIVIGIIAALAIIGSFAYRPMVRNARIRAWNQTMDSVKTALAAYANDHGGHYPAAPSSATDFNSWAQGNGLAKYIDKEVVNPFFKDTAVQIGANYDSALDGDASGNAPSGAVIGYTVSGPDSDGLYHYTMTYKIGGQEYTVKDALDNSGS